MSSSSSPPVFMCGICEGTAEADSGITHFQDNITNMCHNTAVENMSENGHIGKMRS